MLSHEFFPFAPFINVLPNVNPSLCVFETIASLALSESTKALFQEFPKPSYVLSYVLSTAEANHYKFKNMGK